MRILHHIKKNNSECRRQPRVISWVAAVALISVILFQQYPANQRLSFNVYGATSIADLSEKQGDIEKKLAQLKVEKEQLENQSTELKGELSWLNTKSDLERQKYTDLVNELNGAYAEMDASLKEATTAEKTLQDKEKQYKARLQVMFENRNKGTLDMLFDATDLNGFLANIQLITIIAENDKTIIDDLNAAKDEALLKRNAAEEYCDEMQVYVNKKKAEVEALKKNITITTVDLTQAAVELSKTIRDEQALHEESEKITKEIKRLQSTKAYYGGTMVWPTPGYTGINPANYFGMRMHPIYKYLKMHSGVDINAPFNAKIVSAAAGKIIVASTIPGYNAATGNNSGGSGYGNYIIVDHGGGISTLYGHCKLLMVHVGDMVSAGQTIAIVGSTGTSTGAHLHFEVRENGSPVDPIQGKYLGVKN